MKRTHTLPIRIVFSIFLFCVTSCAAPIFEPEENAAIQLDDQPSILVSESINYYSFQSLSTHSDIIIIGKVISEEEVINGARDPEDHTKPLSYFFSASQVYKVEVDEYIKGEGLPEIYITQWQGGTRIENALSPAEIEQIKTRSMGTIYIPLDKHKKYIMFLRIFDRFSDYQIGSYRSGDLFTGVSTPWRFDISNPDCVFPESINTEANAYFHPLPLQDILKLIDEPFIQSEYDAMMRYPPP